MQNPFRKFSSWLLGGVNPKIKAIFFVIIALVAGYICDDQYEAKFPIFKIAFTLVALIMYASIQHNSDEDEGEEE